MFRGRQRAACARLRRPPRRVFSRCAYLNAKSGTAEPRAEDEKQALQESARLNGRNEFPTTRGALLLLSRLPPSSPPFLSCQHSSRWNNTDHVDLSPLRGPNFSSWAPSTARCSKQNARQRKTREPEEKHEEREDYPFIWLRNERFANTMILL